jgi:hypothetical protein
VARAKRNGGALAVCRHMKKKDELPDSVYTSFPARIVVAFYPLTKGITLKANMCQVLVQQYGAPRVFSDITPETYILTPRREVNATGLSDQRALWLRAMASERHSKTIWIAKISHGAKGRGIVLIRPPGDERAAAAATAAAGSAASSSSIARTASQFLADLDRSSDANPWVVQLYVDNPMLLSGRKFDLRAWVLLTPRLDIMLYREGVARMCSVPYSNDDFSVFGHISNHCLQVQSADFGKGLSKTNELAWTELDQLLLRHKKRGVGGMGVFAEPGAAVGGSMSMDEDVLPQMKRIVHDTFACIKSKVLETYTAGAIDAFQLFGFDFVLDATGKLWLCEVNGAAGMAQHLLHPMIEDLADTVIWDMLPAARPKDFQRKNGRPNWFTKWFSRDQW